MCFNALLAIMEDSEIFSGEVTIDLAQSPLDEEAEWHYLTTYKNGLPDHLVGLFISKYSDFSIFICRRGVTAVLVMKRPAPRLSWLADIQSPQFQILKMVIHYIEIV